MTDWSARLFAGEEAARVFADFARSEAAAVLRLSRRLVGDPEEARDVAQDALLRAYRALSGFRGESSLRTWVLRIVVHEALKRLRRERLRERVLAWLRPRAWELCAVSSSDPERHLDSSRMARALARTLAQLPTRQRVVLTLRFEEGLSLPEIAAVLGIGPGTVKTHLVRAVGEVRRRWREECDEEG